MSYSEYLAKDGVIEKFWLDDVTGEKYHRLDGPAYVEVDAQTGQVLFEAYWVNGKLHSDNGPARVWYSSKDGSVVDAHFFKHGVYQKKKR